jgi:hypothetical protein
MIFVEKLIIKIIFCTTSKSVFAQIKQVIALFLVD